MDQRANELFAEALEQPTQLRRQFLAARCEGDAALLAEVSNLLDWDSQSEGLLETPIWRLAHSITPETGTVVNNWVLREEIGAGGMGTVFRAERTRGEVTQQAAIKFIRGGGETMRARFQREQQILARLEHPFHLTIN
ncbi:MAG: hypothetical protein U5J83_04770 [Bryobacterales bacterium]|nr:hypothetical protein [Bryobacterales bacterium]